MTGQQQQEKPKINYVQGPLPKSNPGQQRQQQQQQQHQHQVGDQTDRQDRTGDTRAGGVAALVRQTVPHERVIFPATDIENVAVRLPRNTYVALTPTQEKINNDISALRLDKPDINDDDKDYQPRMQTSPKEIWNIIKKLPSKKASGVDEIHNAVIKNLPQKVARITDEITDNFSKDTNTAMALLDTWNAFDRVWFEGLTFKLLKISLPRRLVRLLDSYMTGRTLQVRIGTELSMERSVKAGVLQGSVLGPKLFAYYLYDMPTFSKTRLVLYADDTAPMHTLSVQR
ncbi:uncharacterized protein LOC135129437 [Zophobas morio]|uniref:uncharacterized protein LOC135129437 n=1 Tax=Zophobas morio TaxID=2755281 RepID=UPI0030836EFE